MGGNIDCSYCDNLISLKGAPDKVGGVLNCKYCKNLQITDQDRKKYRIEN